MSEWSDDNKLPVAPPPSTEAPLHSSCAEEQPKEREKVQGKRAGIDESACKKRKTVGAAPRKLGGISLGGIQTTRT